MRLSLIVAVADNGVIGRDGELPWRLPDDMKHFRRVTLGKAVIMGRRTWESLPNGPLKRRLNVVVTRRDGYLAEGAVTAGSLDEAIEAAARGTLDGGPIEEAVIIGGASLYAEALPRADVMWVTHVQAVVEGDVLFPEVDWAAWRATEEVAHPTDARHAHPFRAVRYERAG